MKPLTVIAVVVPAPVMNSRAQTLMPRGLVTLTSNRAAEPVDVVVLPSRTDSIEPDTITVLATLNGPRHSRVAPRLTLTGTQAVGNTQIGFCTVESTTVSPLKSQAQAVAAGVLVSVNC